jgi:hypothetical protein
MKSNIPYGITARPPVDTAAVEYQFYRKQPSATGVELNIKPAAFLSKRSIPSRHKVTL